MSGEQGDNDTGEKVVRLFPGRKEDVGDGLEHRPEFDWQDAGALEREIQGVLSEARPADTVEGEARLGPDSAHRNAIRCPQCDRYTWRRTRYCQHCHADLAGLAAERRQAILWGAAIVSWGVAAGCVYVEQHYALPPRMHILLNLVGFAIVGVNAFGFWIAAHGERE